MVDGYFVVGNIRHPYDIMASRFRTRIVGDKGNGSQETVQGTRKGFLEDLNATRANFDVLGEILQKYPNCLLRYEDFYNNHTVIFDMIQKEFGVTVLPDKQKQISDDSSFETNQKRSFIKKRDPQNRIGYSHMGLWVPGTWKAMIPLWGYDLMYKWCVPLCHEWGYDA